MNTLGADIANIDVVKVIHRRGVKQYEVHVMFTLRAIG